MGVVKTTKKEAISQKKQETNRPMVVLISNNSPTDHQINQELVLHNMERTISSRIFRIKHSINSMSRSNQLSLHKINLTLLTNLKSSKRCKALITMIKNRRLWLRNKSLTSFLVVLEVQYNHPNHNLKYQPKFKWNMKSNNLFLSNNLKS